MLAAGEPASQRPGRGNGQRERAKRRQAIRRRRLRLTLGVLLVAAAGAGVAELLPGSRAGSPRHPIGVRTRSEATTTATTTTTTTTTSAPPKAPPSSFAVGLRVLALADTSRTITLPGGATEARPLLTFVRYPAQGSPGPGDVHGAPADTADGPYPLVVFGHGFAVTPGVYTRILESWARAGYVVAAPLFPLENAGAAGGPNEADLTNQPADMSFVISQLLAASAAGSGPFAGLIDPSEVAVAGHSDGGDTALAVAYDPTYRDTRVGAAVILSGAEIPGRGAFAFPAGSPPLLAAQGSADKINLPSETNVFFTAAPRPKYLLRLPGAEHLPPYSTQEPQLGIVERVSTAFLDGYLKHRSGALQRLASLGAVSGSASLLAEP